MCILRVVAVVSGLIAAPLLFSSAETLSARARDADRQGVQMAAAKAQDAPGLRSGGSVGLGAADARLTAPSFTRIVINAGGEQRFEGRGTPGTEITLTLDQAVVGTVRTDDQGNWRLSIAQPLVPGDHSITSSSISVDQTRVLTGQEVRIAIPQSFAGEAVVAYEAPAEGPAAANATLRSRAEDLAHAASEKFSEVVPGAGAVQRSGPAATPGMALPPAAQRTPPKDAVAGRPAEASRPGKLAQATPPAAKSGTGQLAPAVQKTPPPAADDSLAAPVLEWLERSAREYQGTIVKGLSEPAPGSAPPAPASRDAVAAKPAVSPSVLPGLPSFDFGSDSVGSAVGDAQVAVQEWLARANRTYQTEIMRKLEVPESGATVAAERTTERTMAPPPAAPKPIPSQEAAPAKAEPAKKDVPPAKPAEADRRMAEAAKEAPKPIEQVRPLTPPAEPATKPAEKAAEKSVPKPAERSAADDEALRKRVAEEAVRKQAEAAQQKAAEAQRQKDELARQQAEEARRKAEEEARQKANAEAKQRAAEAKKLENSRVAAQKKADEEARSAEARRDAEQKAAQAAELARKAIEAARTGPARRAAERELAAESKKPGDAPGGTGAAGKSSAQPAAKAPAARSPERSTDTRIAEGSGEKGPVDLPPRRRDQIDRGSRSALGAGVGGAKAAGSAGPPVRSAAARPRRAQSCRRAGVEIDPPGVYVVGHGDTLSEIAVAHYGTVKSLGRIVRANRGRISDPDVIRACQRIWLP